MVLSIQTFLLSDGSVAISGGSAVQQIQYNASTICHLKYPSGPIFKSPKKQMRLILIPVLTQHIYKKKSIISTWNQKITFQHGLGIKITELFDVLYIFFQMKSSKFDVNFALRKHISLDQLHFQGSVTPGGHQLPYIRQQRFRLSVRSWNPPSPMSHSDLMANRLEICDGPE